MKTETRIIKQKVPEVWIGGCLQYLPKTRPSLATGGELVAIPGILIEAILQCDDDVRQIKLWSHGL